MVSLPVERLGELYSPPQAPDFEFSLDSLDSFFFQSPILPLQGMNAVHQGRADAFGASVSRLAVPALRLQLSDALGQAQNLASEQIPKGTLRGNLRFPSCRSKTECRNDVKGLAVQPHRAAGYRINPFVVAHAAIIPREAA